MLCGFIVKSLEFLVAWLYAIAVYWGEGVVAYCELHTY